MNETASNPLTTVSAPLPWQQGQWAQLSRDFLNGQLAHAYLLSGSEGLGKSLFAEAFARRTVCQSPVLQGREKEGAAIACGSCVNCRKGGVGNHPDILRIELEEGSKNIKIDQIRRLSEFMIRSSHAGGVKIAIIPRAHLLNANAANALLKTLEEPNEHTHVILVSDHPGRLVATIRSRCQKLAFQVPAVEIAAPWLESIVGHGNVSTILEAADMRPLIALDFAGGEALKERAQLLQGICDIRTRGKSIQQVVALSGKMGESQVLQHFAALLTTLIKYSLTGVKLSEDEPALGSLYAFMGPLDQKSQQKKVGSSLANFYTEVEVARRQLSSSANPNPQLIMESILWRWSRLALN